VKRSAAIQHLRIAAELARVGVVRKSQFKVEFWCQVVMDFLWYVSHVASFEVLFLHAPDIAGWSREHFRVLMGFLFVSDAFMMIWLGQMWRLGRDLKDGKLDPYRVRPASTLFLYAFQQFSLEGCVNMSMALGYLIYGVGVALPGWTASGLLLVAAGIALCCWVRVVVVTLFSILEFWLLGSDAGRFIAELFHATSDRPVDVFGARMRSFLLFIVPVGALTQVPASIVLGRYSLLEGALASLWLFALGLLVFAVWNRSFRRYESALG
jgi:ABC-2 type transport system permease protein